MEAAQSTITTIDLSNPWISAVWEQTPRGTPSRHSCGERRAHLHREGTLIHARIVDQQNVVAIQVLQAGDRHSDVLV